MTGFVFLILSAFLSIFIEIKASRRKLIVNSAIYWFLGVLGMSAVFIFGDFSPTTVGLFRKVLAVFIIVFSLISCKILDGHLYRKYKKITTASFPWGIGTAGTLAFFAVGHFGVSFSKFVNIIFKLLN
jgi:hypothetical protein